MRPELPELIAARLRTTFNDVLASAGRVNAERHEAPDIDGSRLLAMLADTIAPERRDTGTLKDLRPFGSIDAPVGDLVFAVREMERAALASLARDVRFGVETADWPDVLGVVHDAAFALVAECARHSRGRAGTLRDELTDLVVRPVFDLALVHEAGRAHRHQHALSLILFEVDNLAAFAAGHGQGVVDWIVERMGVLIRRFFRHHDWVARHGGRSIAVLLPQTPLDDAADLAHHVRTMVEQRFVLTDDGRAGTSIRLNAAAVGTELVEPALDPYFIVATAEDAIRRIRESGRSRVERVVLPAAGVSLLGAARVLGCGPAQIRSLIRRGELHAVRIGRHFEVNRASLERYRLTHPSQRVPAAL